MTTLIRKVADSVLSEDREIGSKAVLPVGDKRRSKNWSIPGWRQRESVWCSGKASERGPVKAGCCRFSEVLNGEVNYTGLTFRPKAFNPER